MPDLAIAPLASALTTENPTRGVMVGARAQLRQQAEMEIVQSFGAETIRQFNTDQRDALVLQRMLEIIANRAHIRLLTLEGDIISEIEQRRLWETHPSGYDSADQMIADAGISPSERSDMAAITGTIFPYLQEIGIDPYSLYEEVGKTRMRRVTHILRAIIDSNHDGTRRVQEAVQRILDEEVAEVERSMPDIEWTDEMRKEEAVRWIVMQATLHPANALPRIVYHGAEIDAITIFARMDAHGIRIVADVDEDQLQLMRRKLGDAVEITFGEIE